MAKRPSGVPPWGTPLFLSWESNRPATCCGNRCIDQQAVSSAPNKRTRRQQAGFLPWLTMVLICWALSFAGPAHAATAGLPDLESFQAKGNTSNGHVLIMADKLIYHEDLQQILAHGSVRVWYNQLTMTADDAQADLTSQVVKAQGHVTLSEEGRDLECASLTYNLKTGSAEALGIVFATDPWYYQGRSIEKFGDKEVIITEPAFTTCNARHPHYHLKARTIDVVLGDALTAYDATLCIGDTPIFWIPWFRRSLSDDRPPFSLQLGYNDFEGYFANIKYNYFFNKRNYGGVLLNLMEKTGVGTGLDHFISYQALGEGNSELHFLYVFDPRSKNERVTGNLVSDHHFTPQDDLKLSLQYLSDRNFNREFSSTLVDSYQQQSTLFYNHQGSDFNFNANILENLAFDPLRNQYYTAQRQLPSLSYSLFSKKITDFLRPVYFGFSGTFDHGFIGQDSSDAVVVQNRYTDDLKLTPTLTQNYVFPMWVTTQPSLAWSLSTPLRGSNKEWLIPGYEKDLNGQYALLNASYNTSVTLTNKWVNYVYTKPTHLVETRLTYDFQRTLDLLHDQSLPNAGVTSEGLRLKLTYNMGNFLYNEIGTRYSLLPVIHWYEAWDNPLLTGYLRLPNFNLNWQGTYSMEHQRVNSGNVNFNYYSGLWNVAVNTSYSLVTGIDRALKDSLFVSFNGGLRPPGWGLGLQGSVQYNVIDHQFTNFTLNLTRDLHCWTGQASFKVYQDGHAEIGFGLNIKAFPEIKAGMGSYGGATLAP